MSGLNRTKVGGGGPIRASGRLGDWARIVMRYGLSTKKASGLRGNSEALGRFCVWFAGRIRSLGVRPVSFLWPFGGCPR